MKERKQIIEGLELIIKGATQIKEALSSETTPVAEPKVEDKEETKAKEKEKAIAKKPTKAVTEEPKAEETEEQSSEYTKEYLDGLKYNELKKLGSSLGVSCKGTRAEITERILSLNTEDSKEVVEEAEEPVEEKEESKVTPINKKKPLKSKAVKEEEPEEEEEEDEFIEQAKEILEETEEKDVIEALKEVGIKVTKKTNLVEALADAIRNDLLDVSEEDDEEEEEEEEDTENGEEAVLSVDSYFPEYDTEGLNDPEKMTKRRKVAIEEMVQTVIDELQNSDRDEFEDAISEFVTTFCTEEELEEFSEDYTFEDLLALYIETRKKMIDEDGEEHEAKDPYVLNDENFCCGHELRYDKKSDMYICEVCGEEYDAE